jgi:hypothetical protein
MIYFGCRLADLFIIDEAPSFRRPSDTAGRARARDLKKQLPDALYLVETREQCFGFSPETQKAIRRMRWRLSAKTQTSKKLRTHILHSSRF